MLKFNDIKNEVVIKRTDKNKVYFNKDDINYFNTDTSKILAFNNFGQGLFILDNNSFDHDRNMQMFNIKFYSFEKGKMNTLLSINDYEVTKSILEILKSYSIAYTKEQLEIILTGELDFSNNLKSMTFKSSYCQNQFELYNVKNVI